MALQLFDALDREWAVLVVSPATRSALRRWSDDPVLARYPDLGALIRALRRGARDPERTNQILAALTRRAVGDDLAARTMLQALIPGLVNVTKRLGGAILDEELEAQVLTEAFDRIRNYPLERRPRAIAANVIQDVFGRVCRARSRAQDHVTDAPPAIEPWPDPSVEICELVDDALRAGHLRRCDADLLLSVAVGHDTLTGRAQREGVTYQAMHERWRRARNRLRAAVDD
jgi:hypothetical protein